MPEVRPSVIVGPYLMPEVRPRVTVGLYLMPEVTYTQRDSSPLAYARS
jgi:hypothetical protein